MARQHSVVMRAIDTAALVGAILIAVNHGGALLRGDVSGTRLAQMLLTVLAPYVVSTFSSVAAMREQGMDDRSAPRHEKR